MRHLLVLTTVVFASAALGQPLEKWGYPDVGEFTKATLVLCSEQRDSVILATRFRNGGRAREEVLSLVPPNSQLLQLRVVEVYRENIEDVYAFPNVGLYSMVAFRAEVCRREIMSARRLGRFETVHEKVAACESRHGKERSKELHSCVLDVVDGM